MKFQVREGYVVHLVNRVEVGDGQFQSQEINYYAGQVCDLSADQADLHAHKLEPKDTKAVDYLESKHVQPAPVVGAAPAVDTAAVATAVIAALQAAGLVAKPAAPAA